jgi:alkanesulfonate monooxygenase SsuD/methylene tetrahydromethanopterin reductase-like flavin-dependent oxidoreductase (luciferase family)
MLDNLCDGRFMLGIGRGVGRIEFEGMGEPMEESRERFVECAELVLDGLDQGFVEYAGKYLEQPKRFIRPAPTRTFRGRTYASAVSPESLEIMARLGIGLLLVPQKPWEAIIEEVKTYREIFEQVNDGEPAPLPLVCNEVFVDTDAVRANELGALLIGNYYQACLKHHELDGQHFTGTKGYEFYARSADAIQTHDLDTVRHWYTDLQVFGTPDQCVEKGRFSSRNRSGAPNSSAGSATPASPPMKPSATSCSSPRRSCQGSASSDYVAPQRYSGPAQAWSVPRLPAPVLTTRSF